jgi:outer membrane lipoprotein LolB
MRWRAWVLNLCAVLAFGLSGCSWLRPAASAALSAQGHWEGKLQLRVQRKEPESFSATFELSGAPHHGELRLISPIGHTLALVNWSAEEATLQEGTQIQTFANMDELTRKLTGAALPLPDLMAWLNQDGPPIQGWEIHANQQPLARRIVATRQTPEPELHLVIWVQLSP